MHGHYLSDEPMHPGLPSRLSSSEPQANSLANWGVGNVSNVGHNTERSLLEHIGQGHNTERSLLEHIGQAPQQTSDRSQAGSQSSLLPYDERLWGRSTGHMPQDQDPRTS